MGSTEKVLIAFIAGAAVGAVAGLLLAPEKGEDFRHGLMDSAKKLSDELKQQASQAMDSIETASQTATNEIKSNLAGAKENFDKAKAR